MGCKKKIVEINPTENMVFLKAKSEIFKKRKEVEWLDNDDIKKSFQKQQN